MLFHIQSFVIISKVFGLTASAWGRNDLLISYSIAIMPRLQKSMHFIFIISENFWKFFNQSFRDHKSQLKTIQKHVFYDDERTFLLAWHETRFWSYDWLFLSSLRSILHQTLWWWRKVVGSSVERTWPSWWTKMVRKRPHELLGNKKDRAAFIVQVLFQPEQPILLILINHVPSCNILNFLPGC